MGKLLVLVGLVCATASANPDIDACLKAWGKHPFGANPSYTTLKASVKIMGIGSNLSDSGTTPKPVLLLVKPSVGVMTKQKMELLNPNGWYCIKGPVTVLGKSEISAHCKAHLANSDDGTTIMGSDNTEGGVTVLGKVQIEKVGCN